MSDIVERLRNNAMYPEDSRNAAADEIDRLRAEVASLKEERDTAKMNESFWKHAHKVDTDGLNVKVDHLTQQLAAANGRVERQAQVIAEALHELDSSVVDWDSPVMRASQLLQAEVDAALSNLNEDGRVAAKDLLPAERDCCGTFMGSQHRATCPDKAVK
jgi:chromosome segregation ATPase